MNYLPCDWQTGTLSSRSKDTSSLPCDRQTGTQSSRSNGKDNEFGYKFLILFEPCKISKDNFIADRKFTSTNYLKNYW